MLIDINWNNFKGLILLLDSKFSLRFVNAGNPGLADFG
jgi:hypothetical protein